jgi:hypothetical protein
VLWNSISRHKARPAAAPASLMRSGGALVGPAIGPVKHGTAPAGAGPADAGFFR